jgi:hypothetical protein
MLAGHPFAGKSMLVGGLLTAMEEGDRFLGLETRPASALLLTEENAMSLRDRAGLLGLLTLRGEYVSPAEGALALGWPRLIKWATGAANRSGHELLIIDTFSVLAGLGEEQENDAGAITERLRPLREAAAEGLAVLLLHHMNAQGRARGSSAFRGVTDVSIALTRVEGSNTITLKTQSRFAATPPILKAKLVKASDGWFYEPIDVQDPTGEVARINTGAMLWEALCEAGPDGITYDEINALPGLSAHKAKKRFPGWFDQGKIGRYGAGEKGDSYRWFVLDAAIRCGASSPI